MNIRNYGQKVRFQVLGPVQVTAHEADLPLGGRQQRLVLALLIAANGRPVSTSSLIDDIWGDEPPPSARKALQGYVHHLRSELGDVLTTETNGYSLTTNGDVDAVEFESLHSRARDLSEDDPGHARDLLGSALDIWNGSAYADLADELALTPEITRLESLRSLAIGDRIDTDLALGRHAALIGELEGLTQEFPLQERFWAQQMTALFRSGRHVEALRTYERFRRQLADEMGLDPSTDLQSLHSRILAEDDSLKGPESTASSPMAVRGYELREVVSRDTFGETHRAYQRSIGREVAVRVLDAEVADDPRFIADFLSDTKAVAALEHPHIHFVFDTWREPGHAYQVSRWLGGGSLADAVVSGPMSIASTLRMLDEIGGALGHAHREGVIHGRIEPRNVLFDDTGHAYLSDFSVGSDRARTAADDSVNLASVAHVALARRPPALADGLAPDLAGVDVPAAVVSVFETAFAPEGYPRPEDFVRALRQAAGLDVQVPIEGNTPLVDLRNPYKGLQTFQETDSDDFFGRDDLVDRIVDTMESNRLVGVVGPSGSGKSSVVKAGVLPKLRQGSNAPLRLISEMYPGAYPFEELENALLRIGVDRTSVIDELVADQRGLSRVLKHILPNDDAELVLVIDQFEELFSMVSSEETRQLFLDSLVAATSDPRSRLSVILTMRADFFDRPLGYPQFGEIFEAALVPVTVPNDQQLAMAISQPAHSVGVEFEEGLIAQIVNDVGGQPGSLPLLQYALTELFDDRDSGTITLATYQRGGGVFGALGRRAEALYEDLSEPGKKAIRQAFLRMVTIDEGADDVRRRVRRSQLHGDDVHDGALTEALQLYGAHRLLTFDLDPVTSGPTVEVAHEALLREWPRLGGWIDDQRDDLVIRKRLDASMTEWKSSGEDASYLPTGGRLAQFDEWSSDTTLSLTLDERAFLESATEREKDSVARSARRRRGALVGLAAASVILAALAGFAFIQKGNADDSAAEATAAESEAREAEQEAKSAASLAQAAGANAETSRLGATAQNVAETFPELGLLVAAEAHNREVNPETLGALQRVLVGSGTLSRTVDLGLRSSGVSGDGRFVSVWNDDAESQGPLFDVSGPEPVAIDPPTGPIERRHAGLCESFPFGCPGVFNSWVDFERGGADLLVQSVDGVLHIYSGHDFDQPLIEIRNVTQTFLSSPDGRLFVHGKFCPTVEDFNALTDPNACSWFGFDVVDLETGDVVFSDPEHWARAFSWSADGSRLYRITGENEVAVWDTAMWTEVDFVGGDPVDVNAIDSPLGGAYMAVTDGSGTVRLLDPNTGVEQNRINGLLAAEFVGIVEFSSDGSLMMSVVNDTARLWDPVSGQQIGVPMVTEVSAPWTKSGETIQLVTETDSGIHLWNLDTATWFDTACKAAGRNMTRAEWDQFGPRDTDYRATCPQYDIES